MRIVGPDKAAIRLSPQYGGGVPREIDEAPDETRALVPVAPVASSERAAPTSQRPAAAFVAHLIATRMQAPQTRARRRAEPGEAIAVYNSMTKPVVQSKAALGKRV